MVHMTPISIITGASQPFLFASKLKELEAEKAELTAYLASKVNGGKDYHGVSDAAMDIREIDAKLELLKELEQ